MCWLFPAWASFISIHHQQIYSLAQYWSFLQGQSASQTLIDTFRTLFIAFGVPEEISSNGGPHFIAHNFQTFLSAWGIKHCLSSIDYPQIINNGRAELGVKSAKRIISDNTSKDGSLNNDKATHAIMQYCNTPLPHINLSPAQLLLHRQLQDHLPSNLKLYHLHKEWIITAAQYEEAFAKKNSFTQDKYDTNSHTLPSHH